MLSDYDYEMLVIGSGPAGQRAAVQAAKLGRRVAIVERLSSIGGVCVSTGTVSKTLREAVLHLTGLSERTVYGQSYVVKEHIKMSDLMARTQHVMEQHSHILRSQLSRNDIEMINAYGSMVDRHTVNLASGDGRANRTVTTDKLVIAVGTYSTVPPVVHADGRLVFVSDDVLNLPEIPRTLTIVGAGNIGLEYCGTFAALGVRVTMVDPATRLLPAADAEISESLAYHLRQRGVTLRLEEMVFDIEYSRAGRGDHVKVKLGSGKQIVSDAVMYCIGRTGCTESLGLENAGLKTDERGRVSVDENCETEVDGIYAVGGVIGFPDLVSTSQVQGRLAACHAFGVPTRGLPELFPYAVKTIPEMAMVGMTEEQLTEQGVRYEVGKAQFEETMQSVIRGQASGFLKLLFEIDTRKLLGVHCIGEGSAELVHIGQAVIAHDGTIDYFVDSVASYPTMAEAYTTAALNGLNRLRF